MNQAFLADWATYRPALLPLIEQTQARNQHHFAHQIDQALLTNRAFLFVATDGFMALEPRIEQGEPGVNILFAWNEGGNAGIRYQPLVEQLARDIGAKWVEFQTKVAGIDPICRQLGYQLTEQDGDLRFYRKQLPQGVPHGRQQE